MTANAFSLYLPDFARRGSERTAVPVEMEAIEPANPPEDPGKAIAEALERGRREALATARAEFERIRATDLVRYDERLLEERRRWTDEESDRIAKTFVGAFLELEGAIVASVARILTPFVSERVRRSALDEFSELLTALLAGEQLRTLTISGPEDLLEPLRGRLGAYAAAIEFRPGEGAEVRAVSGETIVETQIGAWTARLADAAAE